MHTVKIDEAQTKLPQLIDEVLKGEEVVILCENAPSVKLVPAIRLGFGALKGQITMSDDFNAPLDDFAEYMP